VTCSPNAALTNGGPARNIVPILSTIIASCAIVGTYAAPAVQLPQTMAIWQHRQRQYSYHRQWQSGNKDNGSSATTENGKLAT